jgi:hypothetical protein
MSIVMVAMIETHTYALNDEIQSIFLGLRVLAVSRGSPQGYLLYERSTLRTSRFISRMRSVVGG